PPLSTLFPYTTLFRSLTFDPASLQSTPAVAHAPPARRRPSPRSIVRTPPPARAWTAPPASAWRSAAARTSAPHASAHRAEARARSEEHTSELQSLAYL